MKIAKKVLALVMAVAMVACFAAIASAATPTANTAYQVTLKDGSEAGYGYALVLSIENGVGLKAGGVLINYDPAVLVYADDNAEGSDAAAMSKLIKSANSFTYEANGDTEGVIDVGFYFKENLWTTEEFLANKKGNASEDDVKAIEVNSFELVEFYFDLADGASADDIVVSLEYKSANFVGDDGNDVAFDAIKLIGIEKKAEEPSTEDPSTEAPSTEAPSTQAPTTAPVVDDGDNKTGDTGVLAIAAGVVALAGAAFVVTKKRK